MCPIADATLFPEVHTPNGKNVQDYPTTTLRRWGCFEGSCIGQAVFTLKTCSGLENNVRTSFSMSGSVGLTPVITVGAM